MLRSWLRFLIVAVGCSLAAPSVISQPIIINRGGGGAELGGPEEIIDPEATGFWLVPMAARLDVVLPRPTFMAAVGIDTSIFLGGPVDAELPAMDIPLADNHVPSTSPFVLTLPSEGDLAVRVVQFETPTKSDAAFQEVTPIEEMRPITSTLPAKVQPFFQIETEAAYHERLNKEARQRATTTQWATQAPPLVYPVSQPRQFVPVQQQPTAVVQPAPTFRSRVYEILSWPLRWFRR